MLRRVVVLYEREIRAAVLAALDEDAGRGDATTIALIPADQSASALVVAREPLVLAGLAFARCAFQALDPGVNVTPCQVRDGDFCAAGRAILRVDGPACSLLTAERVALNFLQRLCAIATLTNRFTREVAHTRARILDTRKTTPGWRRFEKYAVAQGGGTNHRMGLDDLVMVKDNHLVALRDAKPSPIHAAVARSRQAFPHLRVEVEADTLDQVALALDAGADTILLDNMSLDQLRAAVAMTQGRASLEASGGIRLENVRAVAETGVDFISVGALTHSAGSSDIALDFLDLANSAS